jgi:hypothetical protein
MIQPATRSLTRAELASVDAQTCFITTSRNYANLVAALRNVHAPSISAALVEAVGTVAARQIARDVERMAGGGK